jgi:hypothetical protein
MKRLFIFGLIVGFAGALAAAYLFPWVSYPRYPSATTVVANGGRAEHFVIRLPADRIESHATQGDPAGHASVRVDHFKLRDTEGNVVGLAARHSLGDEPGSTAWLLSIPSRGTVMLHGVGRALGAVEPLLVEHGFVPGREWSGRFVVEDAAVARSVAATQEFAGLDVELKEIWTISGVSPDGQVRGTIEFDTVGRSGS